MTTCASFYFIKWSESGAKILLPKLFQFSDESSPHEVEKLLFNYTAFLPNFILATLEVVFAFQINFSILTVMFT